MAASTQASVPQSSQMAQLRQLLKWLGMAVLASGAFYLCVALLLKSPVAAVLAANTFGFGVMLWLARSRAARGDLRAAVILTSSGIFLLGLITVPVLPAVLPVLTIAPIMAVAVALLYIEGRALYNLSIVAGLISLLITATSQFITVFADPPPLLVTLVLILIVPAATVMTLLLLGQFHHRLTETLSQTQSANEALRDAQATLEAQVAERTTALRLALEEVEARAAEQARLIAENAEQRSTIYELSVPVLPISANTLVMPLVGALDSTRLLQVQERALQAIERSSARFLVLDITGVPIVDTQVAQGLMATIQAARLLGAEVSLVGIRPEVAQAIVGLGLDLREVRTSSDLRMALGGFVVR